MVDLVAAQFSAKLDFSDASIATLEAVLETFHREAAAAAPPIETVEQYAKGFGSYVGEVFRRNHGATWGQVTLDGKTFPGMRAPDGSLVWPWGRVLNRLTQGAAENVADYYAHLVREAAPAA